MNKSIINKKYLIFLKQIIESLRCFPIEIIIAFFATMLFIFGTAISKGTWLLIIPFLSLTYTFNNLFKSSRWRFLYFACLLLPVIFFIKTLDWTTFFPSEKWLVIISILSPLLILSARRKKDNASYSLDVLNYGLSVLYSLFFTSVIYLLFLGIFFSVTYIFEIELSQGINNNVTIYGAYICYVFNSVILFLAIFNRSSNSGIQKRVLLDWLFNKVITPASILYMFILYIYLGSIIVKWELPVGNISYPIFIFFIITIVVGVLRESLASSYFKWYFHYFPFLAIPILLLFWFGVARRIDDYGLTLDRVYLIVCGIIMSFSVIIRFFKKNNIYLLTNVVAIIILSIALFVPYISAEDLSLVSQKKRIDKIATRLNLFGKNKIFEQDSCNKIQPTDIELLGSLASSINYVNKIDTSYISSLGLSNVDEFYSLFDEKTISQIKYGKRKNTDKIWLSIHAPQLGEINLSDYSSLIFISDNKSFDKNYIDGWLTLKYNDTKYCKIDIQNQFDKKIKELGLANNTELNTETFQNEYLQTQLLTFETDSMFIFLSSARIELSTDSLIINDPEVQFVLIKRLNKE